MPLPEARVSQKGADRWLIGHPWIYRSDLLGRVAEFVAQLRRLGLKKSPSIAETLDWARALVALGIRELDAESIRPTLAVILKHEEDIRKAGPKINTLKRGA